MTSLFLRLKFVLLPALLLQSTISHGVIRRDTSKELILHLDKSAYFIGETMWYKIYKNDSEEAKAFYLELYDKEGGRIIVHKHKAVNNMSSGNLTLPNTLKTGTYALVMSEDQALVGYRKNILIINPQDEKSILSKVPFVPSGKDSFEEKSWDVKFALRNQAIERRGKVQLDIKVRDDKGKPINGNFSFAIKQRQKMPSNSNLIGQSKMVTTTKSYNPMVIKGNAVSGNGVDLTNKMPLVLQFILDNTSHTVITNKKGEFEIPIDQELEGTNQLYFMNSKYFSENGIPMNLEFQADKPAFDPEFELSEHTLDLQYIAEKNLEKQAALSSFFASGNSVYNSINYEKNESGIQINHEPDRLVVPDYYEKLPTMQEVFRELIGTVRLRKTEEGFRIAIRHQDLESVIRHDPLMLVDGQPETDLEKILELNPRELEKIEVFFSKEKIIQFGITGSNGILSITTKKGNYIAKSIPTYEVEGFAKKRDFLMPDFDGDMKENPTPDLRTLLYWNSNIEVANDGSISLVFFNSDSLGDFEVEMFGKTVDGRIITEKTTIKGKNSL